MQARNGVFIEIAVGCVGSDEKDIAVIEGDIRTGRVLIVAAE